MKHTGILLVLIALAVLPGLARAQSDPLDEAAFWQRMQETNALLRDAIGRGNVEDVTLRVNKLWDGVEAIRLANGTVMAVDVSWLRLPPTSGLDTLRQREMWISALLDYQARRTGAASNPDSMLSALDRVLQDKRFRYGEEPSPTEPEPDDAPRITSSGSPSLLSPALSQIILIAAGVVVALAVLLYLAQSLQVQPAETAVEPDGDDIPPNADTADALAERSGAAADYRAAIRYLYLACLLFLDERGLIQFDPALTNYEHLRQTSGPLHTRLAPVVGIFDRVWYGFAPVDETLYQQFRQHVDQLKQDL